MPLALTLTLLPSFALVSMMNSPISAPESLNEKLAGISKLALTQFKGLKEDDFAITVIELKGGKTESGSYRGSSLFYPASVVKMFYMAYAKELLEKGKIESNPELERAMTDMIKESVNDATGLVLETITGTTGGPALGESDLKVWMRKRQAVNEWLYSLGYKDINCSQKTWNEGPYGRERQGYGPNFELRNSLNTDSCARMIFEIVNDKVVTPGRCSEMRELLKRSAGNKDDGQSNYFGASLPMGTEFFSKAGWTSTVRHDVAYVKLAERQLAVSVFTKFEVGKPDLIRFLSDSILKM